MYYDDYHEKQTLRGTTFIFITWESKDTLTPGDKINTY